MSTDPADPLLDELETVTTSLVTDVSLAAENAGMWSFSAKLAYDLASRINSIDEVRRRYGLAEDQLRRLLQNPTFQRMLVEAQAHWASDKGAAERIKVKAQIALEESIPDIYLMVKNKQLAHSARLEAGKLLSDLAHARQSMRSTSDSTASSGSSEPRVSIRMFFNGKDNPAIVVDSSATLADEAPGIDTVEIT